MYSGDTQWHIQRGQRLRTGTTTPGEDEDEVLYDDEWSADVNAMRAELFRLQKVPLGSLAIFVIANDRSWIVSLGISVVARERF